MATRFLSSESARLARNFAAAEAPAETFTEVAAAAAAPRVPTTVFVDLSTKPAETQVVREGFKVPTVDLVPDALRDYLAIIPKGQPRVVTQSVAAGTTVTRGTTIDLVLVEPGTIPGKIFDGHHLGLA